MSRQPLRLLGSLISLSTLVVVVATSSLPSPCAFTDGLLSYSFSTFRNSHITIWTSFRDQWDIHEWSYHIGICDDIDAFTVAARSCASGIAPAFQITSRQELCYRLGAATERSGFEALGNGQLGASFRTWGGDGGRGTRVLLQCSTRAQAYRSIYEVAGTDGLPVYIYNLSDPLFCPTQCFVDDTAGWWGGTVCSGHGTCEAEDTAVGGGGSTSSSAHCVCDSGFTGPSCATAVIAKPQNISTSTTTTVATSAAATTTTTTTTTGNLVRSFFSSTTLSDYLLLVYCLCLLMLARYCLRRRKQPSSSSRSFRVARIVIPLLLFATIFHRDFTYVGAGGGGGYLFQPALKVQTSFAALEQQEQLLQSSSGGGFTIEDAAFAARLDAAVAACPDPFDIAVKAWLNGHTWPVSQGQAGRFFVEHPPATLAMTLEATALAALNATKTVEFSTLMPRCLEGEECGYGSAVKGGVGKNAYKFGMGQQEAYYAEYRSSWKAFTFAKTGTDTFRHSQIIASGGIPIFRGIRSLPPTKVFAYPKPLLALFEDERYNTNIRQLAMMRHRILEWGYKHLSARASIIYRLRAAAFTATTLNLPPPLQITASPKPRVAFIDKALLPFGRTDFGTLATLIGLIEHFGSDQVDIFYPPEYVFEGFAVPLDNEEWKFFLYGNGFGFTNVLPPQSEEMRNTTLETKIGRLHRGEYEYVVWGGFLDSLEHFTDPETYAAYVNQPHRLWLCTNHDIGGVVNQWIRDKGHLLAPWKSVSHDTSIFITQHNNFAQ